MWQFSWLVDLHKNYCKTSVGISVDLWISTRITAKQVWQFSWLVDLHKNYCKTSVGNSVDVWISTRITAKQVWQFSWLVDLHKNYCKTSVAIQLTCGSPEQLLQNKCGNSVDLWISTRITAKQVWQLSRLVDLQNNYFKTSVAIQLTCGSPQELLQRKCMDSINLWISTTITANQVWQFSWLLDLHKNYCKTSLVIQLICGSPQELLQSKCQLTRGSPQELLQNKCGNSIDLWISTRITSKQVW